MELTGDSKGRRRRALGTNWYTASNSHNSSSAVTHAPTRRQLQASSTDVEYSVTSTEPVSGTMSSDSYSTNVAGAINSGGNTLPAIDPAAVQTDVGEVSTEVDFVIVVGSDSLSDTDGAMSSADVGSSLGTSLTTSLSDTTAMRAALVATGADICDSCRLVAVVGDVQTSDVQTGGTPVVTVTGRCSGNTQSSDDFDCGSLELKGDASSIVGSDADTCCKEAAAPKLTDEQLVAAAAAGGLLFIVLLCCCCIVIILLIVLYKKKSSQAEVKPVQQADAAVPPGLEQWDTNNDGVLDAAELQAMANSTGKVSGPSTTVFAEPVDDATARFVAHLTSHGVKGNQEEYVRKLIDEGFDTPELFDSLSLEELENDFGFKRGHLRAVEAHRTAHQAVSQQPTAQGP
eukprot:COSAG02_NODE_3055_length_7457_cov_4.988312_5_plen_401_part_00